MPSLKTAETQVEHSRQQLAQSLDALSATVDPARLADQVSSTMHSYGGEIGRQAWSAARANPAGFALMGAGLGLLLVGTGSRPEERTTPPQAVPPHKAMDGFDERLSAADADMKKEMTNMSTASKYTAASLRKSLMNGLDKLPEGARKRVIDARRAALAAQEKIEARSREVAASSRTFHHQQPLAVGALALGMGALIGALLPSTKREDEMLGHKRDALMSKAQHTLEEEMSRLSAAASAKIDKAAQATTGDRA